MLEPPVHLNLSSRSRTKEPSSGKTFVDGLGDYSIVGGSIQSIAQRCSSRKQEKWIAGALKNDAFSVNCVRTSAENTLNGAVNSMTKAVLFDLDGVLVSTDEYHYHSWVKIASEEGFGFFDHAFNDQFRGVGRLECVEILTKASGKSYSSKEKQAIADRKNKYFAESLSAVTPKELLPGAVATLQELKKRGIKIAVASNSRNAQPIIKQTNIGHFLDTIVDGYQIEKSKPDPEGFLLAAKKLDVAPSACLVVEDAVTGVEAARRAGMKALGIGTPERLPNAEIVIPDLSAITVDRLLSL